MYRGVGMWPFLIKGKEHTIMYVWDEGSKCLPIDIEILPEESMALMAS